MAADDYALRPEVEARLQEVCERDGVPERWYDAIRQLLSTPQAEWPACCGGSCNPCVEEQKSLAREVLRELAAGTRSP